MTRGGVSTRVREGSLRLPAPDLARGFMLLLIAVASVSSFMYAQDQDGIRNLADYTVLDRVVVFIRAITVDQRALPLFAFLFGYGMVQFERSRLSKGYSEGEVDKIQRRRYAGMMIFGLAHGALLYAGDILGTYALIALIFGGLFFRRSLKTLVITAASFFGLGAILDAGGFLVAWSDHAALPGDALAPEDSTLLYASALPAFESYLQSIVPRFELWLIMTTLSVIFAPTLVAMVVLGWILARRRFLEEPDPKLLKRWALIGIGIGWLGGLPQALTASGIFLIPESAGYPIVAVSLLTGCFGGFGYMCLIALISLKVCAPNRKVGPFTEGLLAMGKRSLTGYIVQSLVFAPMMCAWGLGLGSEVGQFGATMIACAVWYVTVLVCVLLDRKGYLGPLELLLRRFAYGKMTPPTQISTQG